MALSRAKSADDNITEPERMKLNRHIESPNHKEKVSPLVGSLSTLLFQTPRCIVIKQDIIKMNKDSSRHCLEVAQVVETQLGDMLAEGKDIRSQLLRTEQMQFTPLVSAYGCHLGKQVKTGR